MHLLRVLKNLFRRKKSYPTEIETAVALIKAINRGGVPSNPIKINAIARDLGLEVSASAPIEQTIERIRLSLKRSGAL